MYGSYGSYSSMCASQMTAPIDIGTPSSNTACAFPSWPRRASLSASDAGSTCSSSSYLSDEDLFLGDDLDYDSSAVSVSSRSNSNASSMSPPHHQRQQYYQPYQTLAAAPVEQHIPSEEELLERERRRQAERQAYQREVLRALAVEKERRKQAASQARRQRRSASSVSPNRKSNKAAKLAAIAETGVESA